MSRGGRPSERAKNEPPTRALAGPDELLSRIKASGGVPEDVITELSAGGTDEQTARASQFIVEVLEPVRDHVEDAGGWSVQFGDDPDRKMAWLMSLVRAMEQSVPFEKRCRHIRAADPHITQIRTVAVLSSGFWGCIECANQSLDAALKTDLWPSQCDLCGAATETFQEFAGNLSGCMVSANICAKCASFLEQVPS